MALRCERALKFKVWVANGKFSYANHRKFKEMNDQLVTWLWDVREHSNSKFEWRTAHLKSNWVMHSIRFYDSAVFEIWTMNTWEMRLHALWNSKATLSLCLFLMSCSRLDFVAVAVDLPIKLRNNACVFASTRSPGHVNWYLQEFLKGLATVFSRPDLLQTHALEHETF